MQSIVEPLVSNNRTLLPKYSEQIKATFPGITCVQFSSDGSKLLTCNELGKIFCWDASQLGEEHNLLATLRVSEKGILSLSCT